MAGMSSFPPGISAGALQWGKSCIYHIFRLSSVFIAKNKNLWFYLKILFLIYFLASIVLVKKLFCRKCRDLDMTPSQYFPFSEGSRN